MTVEFNDPPGTGDAGPSEAESNTGEPTAALVGGPDGVGLAAGAGVGVKTGAGVGVENGTGAVTALNAVAVGVSVGAFLGVAVAEMAPALPPHPESIREQEDSVRTAHIDKGKQRIIVTRRKITEY